MIVNVITKNPGKLASIKAAFSKFGIKVNQIEKGFFEIQADSSLEIAENVALQALRELNAPVIREDHSLFINSLGIPGPYTSFMEKKMPVEKLLEILETQEDRSGYFEIATVYLEPSGLAKRYVCKIPVFFEKEVKVSDPRGGWNGIIRLADEKRTFTEYPEEERLHIWGKNCLALAEFLANREKKEV
ncbi:MAG: non-canonical purine NTP pyrophosphatase [Candidatus Pacebacteria bacterium]|nr:non-canonical purine NTP pyrophosphatase [Candidatus Paceibacterota bacterium]